MKGASYDRFGDESVLRIVDDHPEPPVGPDVVLVRAHAAGVNPVDLAIRAGYLAMGLLADAVLLPPALAAPITGILLALGTS